MWSDNGGIYHIDIEKIRKPFKDEPDDVDEDNHDDVQEEQGPSASNTQDEDEDEGDELIAPMEVESAPELTPRREARRRRPPRRKPSLSYLIRMVWFWWWHTGKLLKIMAIASALIILLLGIHALSLRSNHSYVAVWDPEELASCDLRTYNQTFEELMERMGNVKDPKNFCEDGMVSPISYSVTVKSVH